MFRYRIRSLFKLAPVMALFVMAPIRAYPQDWTLGFESDEGFPLGEIDRHEQVYVIGGTATVATGDAAEGEQVLRFVPLREDNGLLIEMPGGEEGGESRRIRFQARLIGESPDARLVISYGETLGIRPVDDGVEIEVVGPNLTTLKVEGVLLSDWIEFTLSENAVRKTWDLLIGEQAVVTEIPQQPGASGLRDLLVFADGALELDAIRVTVGAEAIAALPPGAGEKGLDTTAKVSDAAAEKKIAAKKREDGLSRVYAELKASASSDPVSGLRERMESMSRFPEGSIERAYETVHMLTMLAYGFKREGRSRLAVASAVQAMRSIEEMEELLGGDNKSDYLLEMSLTKGRVYEDLLYDNEKALQSYQSALSFYPDYARSQKALERVRKKKEREAREGGRN